MTNSNHTVDPSGMSPSEQVARMVCDELGWTFLALADDASGEKPSPGMLYLAPGQDAAAPSWGPASLARQRLVREPR